MIPKVVHYCWLSDGPWDPVSASCFESWRLHLPDFEFRLWDRDSIPKGVPFLERMLEGGDWAFASDYLRLHALDTAGGVYLDLDVEVFRPFSPLLADRAFIGYEDAKPARLGCHVMGSEAGHPFVRACLEFYRQSFRLRWSFPPTMPRIVTHVAQRHFGYARYEPGGQLLRQGVRVHPAHFFTPLSFRQRRVAHPLRRSFVGDDTYALHHWQHGWSWMDRPFPEAARRVPWLFMDVDDWRFVLRRLVWDRMRALLAR